jgi:hypothetical protein
MTDDVDNSTKTGIGSAVSGTPRGISKTARAGLRICGGLQAAQGLGEDEDEPLRSVYLRARR